MKKIILSLSSFLLLFSTYSNAQTGDTEVYEEESYFLEKLKTCDEYESKERRPFDDSEPATVIVGWENDKCIIKTISMLGTPLKCGFNQEKLSEIVSAYAKMLGNENIDLNDNAILKALSDETICSTDFPDGPDYFSEDVLSEMSNNIITCSPVVIDNVNPLTGTITQRIIKGVENDKCIYIETFPGDLKLVCSYGMDSLQSLSDAYMERAKEKAKTGKITISADNPSIIDKLNNDSSVCIIEIPEVLAAEENKAPASVEDNSASAVLEEPSTVSGREEATVAEENSEASE
ncbi:MAG: hypothetical protein LBR70_01900 [Lactobacillaceae bacterium]|nr:hypothetical protein [Lactobacillaceae bacterium]